MSSSRSKGYYSPHGYQHWWSPKRWRRKLKEQAEILRKQDESGEFNYDKRSYDDENLNSDENLR